MIEAKCFDQKRSCSRVMLSCLLVRGALPPARMCLDRSKMPSSYNLKCPVARTLDIIGERWTILILRDLFLEGPRKFQDFERSLSGVSPNTLSARLKRLEEHGMITHRFYEQHPPRAE